MSWKKRAFDVVVATVLAVVAAPVIGVLAIALAVSFRAVPFFVQERVGLDGRTFRFLKLRTLPTSAPAYASKYALGGVSTTRLAATLRRTHVDELPQLFLVIVGRMSLVGPRPELPNLHATLPPAFARLRTSVRPGCAGLWQISCRNAGLIGEAPEIDSLYLETASLRLDLWILWRTTLLMLGLGEPVPVDALPGWVRPAHRVEIDVRADALRVGSPVDDDRDVGLVVT